MLTIKQDETDLPDGFAPLDGDEQELAREVRREIARMFDEGGSDVSQRLNSSWELELQEVQSAIDTATFRFARSTNETTTLQLNTARNRLREELREGIVQGDVLDELRRRVQKVFDHADDFRASRIARTEASRGYHAGQEEGAKQSGVVQAKKWLISADACPICQAIVMTNPIVPLGANFAVRGRGEYREIKHPPAHPFCRCAMEEVLNTEFAELIG